tara:strand:+ start:276 stop:482 length:207 start_codon:yes stop_codon:yes gene_type:complete
MSLITSILEMSLNEVNPPTPLMEFESVVRYFVCLFISGLLIFFESVSKIEREDGPLIEREVGSFSSII